MPSAVVQIASEADIRGVGVGVRTQGGTPRIRGDLTKTVGLIGVFPWCAAGRVASPSGGYEFTSGADLIKTIASTGPNDAWNEIAGVEFGKVEVYNVRGTSPTAGAYTFQGSGAADSLVATARFTGPHSARFKVTVTANATTSTSRDVKVDRYGADGTTLTRTATYLAVQVANGTVTDPGDPDIVFSKFSGATVQASAASATALSAGSYGTVAASDYGAGITAFSNMNGPDVIVCVGVAAVTCDGVNELVQTAHDSAAGYGHDYVASTELGLTKADALVAAALIPGKNIRYAWPGIIKGVSFAFGGYSTGPAQTTVAPGATMAALLQRVDPWTPAAMRYAQKTFAAVNSLEANGLALNGQPDIADLLEGGICPIASTANYGFVPWGEVATATNVDTGLPWVGKSVRYYNYVDTSISNALQADLQTPLDLNLSTGRLGPNTQGIVDKISVFLAQELAAGHLVASINTTDGSASPAYVVDPFGSATPQNIGAGRWDIDIAYRDTPAAEFIVLNFRHGTSINIQSVG